MKHKTRNKKHNWALYWWKFFDIVVKISNAAMFERRKEIWATVFWPHVLHIRKLPKLTNRYGHSTVGMMTFDLLVSRDLQSSTSKGAVHGFQCCSVFQCHGRLSTTGVFGATLRFVDTNRINICKRTLLGNHSRQGPRSCFVNPLFQQHPELAVLALSYHQSYQSPMNAMVKSLSNQPMWGFP